MTSAFITYTFLGTGTGSLGGSNRASGRSESTSSFFFAKVVILLALTPGCGCSGLPTMDLTISFDHCSPSGLVLMHPTLYTPPDVPIRCIPSRIVAPSHTPQSHLSSKLPTF